MIILNTIFNEKNDNITYNFTHDEFNGVVFKIDAKFGMDDENGELFMTCEYDELDHEFNGVEVSNEQSKKACDEFATSLMQSLIELRNSNRKETENVTQ